MTISVNEAKLTKNCATILQVLILKFAFGPETFPGLSRNGENRTRKALPGRSIKALKHSQRFKCKGEQTKA